MSGEARARLDRLVHAVAHEQTERVLAPLFRRLIELAREGGSVCAEIEHRYLTLDDMRAEITRLADELRVEDPLRGVPMPSEAMIARVAEGDAAAAEAASNEYARVSAINRSK